jgi:hypothetical protein
LGEKYEKGKIKRGKCKSKWTMQNRQEFRQKGMKRVERVAKGGKDHVWKEGGE